MIVDPAELLDTVLFDYDKRNLQPNSYDLRVDKAYEIMGGIVLYADGTKELPQYRDNQPQGGWFVLWPDRLYQLEFSETVKMPPNICAISVMRSSMAKSGAAGEVGLYDSGYEGRCGMTVSVKHTCKIQRGASVAQLILIQASTSRLYNGHYLDGEWATKLVRVDHE